MPTELPDQTPRDRELRHAVARITKYSDTEADPDVTVVLQIVVDPTAAAKRWVDWMRPGTMEYLDAVRSMDEEERSAIHIHFYRQLPMHSVELFQRSGLGQHEDIKVNGQPHRLVVTWPECPITSKAIGKCDAEGNLVIVLHTKLKLTKSEVGMLRDIRGNEDIIVNLYPRLQETLPMPSGKAPKSRGGTQEVLAGTHAMPNGDVSDNSLARGKAKLDAIDAAAEVREEARAKEPKTGRSVKEKVEDDGLTVQQRMDQAESLAAQAMGIPLQKGPRLPVGEPPLKGRSPKAKKDPDAMPADVAEKMTAAQAKKTLSKATKAELNVANFAGGGRKDEPEESTDPVGEDGDEDDVDSFFENDGKPAPDNAIDQDL